MQFYGQDTISSSISVTDPYDFSINPDGPNSGSENIPPASDYFFYNQLGNVAFIGFSGAHEFSSMESYFNEACTWASSVDPALVFLVGHWNNQGDGCNVKLNNIEHYLSLLTYTNTYRYINAYINT